MADTPSFRNTLFVPQVISRTITPEFTSANFVANAILFEPVNLGEIYHKTKTELDTVRVSWGITVPPDMHLLFLSGGSPPNIGNQYAVPTGIQSILMNNLLGIVDVQSADYVTIGDSRVQTVAGDIGGTSPNTETSPTGRLYAYVAGVLPNAQTVLTTNDLTINVQMGFSQYKVGF